MNSLVFTAGVQKTSGGSDTLVFLQPSEFEKIDTADWKINQLASMLEDTPILFSSANTARKINPAGWG